MALQKQDFTVGSVGKKLIIFSLPFTVSNLIQVFYPVVDMALIGKRYGSDSLSAIGAAGQLLSLAVMLGVGFTTGGQILISQLTGAGKKDGLARSIGNLFTLTLLLAFAVTAVYSLLGKRLLLFLDIPPGQLPKAAVYLLISGLSLPFSYGTNAVSAVLRGLGDSVRPMLFIGVSAGVKLLCDYICLRWLSLGFGGIAASSVLAHAASLALCCVYMRQTLHKQEKKSDIRLQKADFRIDKSTLSTLLRLGVPLAMRSAAINLSMIAVTKAVNVLRPDHAAAFQVGVRTDDVLTKLTQGITYACSTVTGQNTAARKNSRCVRAVFFSWGSSAVLYAAAAAVLLKAPQAIFGSFTDDQAVKAAAEVFVAAALPSFPAAVLMRGTNGYIQGTGKTGLSFLIALLDGVVFRIGLSLLLGGALHAGLYGFFLGYCLSGYAGAVPGLLYFLFKGIKKQSP